MNVYSNDRANTARIRFNTYLSFVVTKAPPQVASVCALPKENCAWSVLVCIEVVGLGLGLGCMNCVSESVDEGVHLPSCLPLAMQTLKQPIHRPTGFHPHH